MKVLNTYFNAQGEEWFTSLTRSEQVEYISDKNKVNQKKAKESLKEVKYAKRRKSKKKAESDNEKATTIESSGNSNE